MARIDRKRLDEAAFPLVMTVPTRFDDLDAQGHVNNAAAAVILQEARTSVNRTARLAEVAPGFRAMVAALQIEYAGEMYHPQPIEVSTGVLAIGRTSLTIGQVARQDGRPTLYAETVLVVADASGPAAVPEALRAAYEALLIRAA